MSKGTLSLLQAPQGHLHRVSLDTAGGAAGLAEDVCSALLWVIYIWMPGYS